MSSLGRASARAAFWAFLSTAGAKLIALIGLALLARLLAPGEFGLLAFAMVYIMYAETIGDLGSGMALIYWPDRRDDAAQVTFVVSIASGLFWCASTILVAPAIAGFFNSPDGAPIVRALAAGFIIKYLGNTHDALAQKDLRFRARLLPDLSMAVVNATVSLGLAWLGWGVWSLVWGRLAALASRTALLWVVVPWRPSLRFPSDLVKPMLAYGRGILLVNVIGAVIQGADAAVVGRMFGTVALGFYQMASRVPEATVMTLLWALSAVLFPAFAKLHASGEGLRGPYLVVTRYISAITIPAAIGLVVLSRPIVQFFFGPRWLPAAPILSALAIVAALRCLSAHAGDVLKATGHAQLLVRLSVAKALLIVPSLIIGARYGAIGVAFGLVVATAIGTIITLVFASRIIGVSLREIAASFYPSIAAGLIMAVPLLFWTRWSAHIVAVGQVAAGVALGALVYGLALSILDPDLLRRARQHFSGAVHADELLREATH